MAAEPHVSDYSQLSTYRRLFAGLELWNCADAASRTNTPLGVYCTEVLEREIKRGPMPKRMSDTALAALAREYKAHRAAADQAAAALLAEVVRRKVDVGEKLEVRGVRLRHKQWRRRKYSVAAIRATLRSALAKQVIVEHVDVTALDELVRTGKITDVDAKECFDGWDEGAEYVDVTIVDPSA